MFSEFFQSITDQNRSTSWFYDIDYSLLWLNNIPLVRPKKIQDKWAAWDWLVKIGSVLKCVKSVVSLPVQKEKGYTSLQDEAVKIFNSLQEMEAVSDPVPIIQGILQTCQDLRSLRDEVYCQLIKQTNHVPHPNSPANRAHWHLLTCMSCTFLPSRGILRYLRFHLKRCTVLFGMSKHSS